MSAARKVGQLSFTFLLLPLPPPPLLALAAAIKMKQQKLSILTLPPPSSIINSTFDILTLDGEEKNHLLSLTLFI